MVASIPGPFRAYILKVDLGGIGIIRIEVRRLAQPLAEGEVLFGRKLGLGFWRCLVRRWRKVLRWSIDSVEGLWRRTEPDLSMAVRGQIESRVRRWLSSYLMKLRSKGGNERESKMEGA